jgi:hypothetical protein
MHTRTTNCKLHQPFCLLQTKLQVPHVRSKKGTTLLIASLSGVCVNAKVQAKTALSCLYVRFLCVLIIPIVPAYACGHLCWCSTKSRGCKPRAHTHRHTHWCSTRNRGCKPRTHTHTHTHTLVQHKEQGLQTTHLHTQTPHLQNLCR